MSSLPKVRPHLQDNLVFFSPQKKTKLSSKCGLIVSY